MPSPLPQDSNRNAAQLGRPLGVATVGTANFQNSGVGEEIYIVQNLSTTTNVYYIVATTNTTVPSSSNALAVFPASEKAIPVPPGYYLRTDASVSYCRHQEF